METTTKPRKAKGYNEYIIEAIRKNFNKTGMLLNVTDGKGKLIDSITVRQGSGTCKIISKLHGDICEFMYVGDSSNCGFGGTHRFNFYSGSQQINKKALAAIIKGAMGSIATHSAAYYTSNNAGLTNNLIEIGYEKVYSFTNQNSNRNIDVLIIKLR